ncbi:hypothetical protein OE88DRAFT_650277 [Heliocybe sulcata]|uniref:Uncharacterized protein n=1 Tax=Heliocybe sulcata TaxID=5364 RepID=A0A5C3NCZ1_9AGAM|nr:hypothetical protein OE88DRAFT_650277 [Heliocybe sulcata]
MVESRPSSMTSASHFIEVVAIVISFCYVVLLLVLSVRPVFRYFRDCTETAVVCPYSYLTETDFSLACATDVYIYTSCL